MAHGQWGRGLEEMAPVAMRSPLRALRFAREGALDKTGIEIQPDINPVEVGGQALGFSPSSVREMSEYRGVVLAVDRHIEGRRKALVNTWVMARMAGDAEGAREVFTGNIRHFNQVNPTRRINMADLVRGAQARKKRLREAEDGVYLPRRHHQAANTVDFLVDE
jgi:hypothetical protein